MPPLPGIYMYILYTCMYLFVYKYVDLYICLYAYENMKIG
jgi:hypothetical protein